MTETSRREPQRPLRQHQQARRRARQARRPRQPSNGLPLLTERWTNASVRSLTEMIDVERNGRQAFGKEDLGGFGSFSFLARRTNTATRTYIRGRTGFQSRYGGGTWHFVVAQCYKSTVEEASNICSFGGCKLCMSWALHANRGGVHKRLGTKKACIVEREGRWQTVSAEL